MGYIESAKSYTGNDLESIFFLPMLTGPSALDLGVKVVYNMPVPTTVQIWSNTGDILQKFTTNGWSGGNSATKQQKTIELERIKAEMGFSASDYFSLVYDQIASNSDINMGDLTGTELEAAETELFKRAITESIRATMWVGDPSYSSNFNTFTGFMKRLVDLITSKLLTPIVYLDGDLKTTSEVIEMFDRMWSGANEKLRNLKGDGELVYFVSSDMYELYEKYLDEKGTDSSYVDAINGRQTLLYHGIPVVDVKIGPYIKDSEYPDTFCLLTDRRNLVVAVNTSDFPGAEVKMWYNPDEMENRQRATFLIGCDIIDPDLVQYTVLDIV